MQDAIFITGGAGFIGSSISRSLADLNSPLVLIDSLHQQIHPNQSWPKNLPSNAHLLLGDICEESTWTKALQTWRPKVVFHLAAETGTGQSLSEASRHANVNVLGTTRMLDAFSKSRQIPEKIILSSSRAIYGEGAWTDKKGVVRYPLPRTVEQMKRGIWAPIFQDQALAQPQPHNSRSVFPAPRSIYGSTKLAQENILSNWCDAYGTSLATLRLQNVYGPGQSPTNPYTGIVTLFHKQAFAGKRIEVYEDGLIGRDFVLIDDVTRAMIATLKTSTYFSAPIDVGTGRATTILEAARFIASMYNAPTPEVCGKYRAGDVRWAVADPDLMASQLGISDFISFEDGNKRLGQWLVSEGHM